jgi:UDPglucose 6-dehydrogenase
MKIGFIGLGKLGKSCAEVISQKGHNVIGYDIAPVVSDFVEIKSTIKECVDDREIVFIAVPTPHDADYDGRAPTSHREPRDFDYNIVKSVIAETNKHMNKSQLLVLISTVLPGTVRREFVHLVTNTRFAYNPYLIAMGSVAWDMVNPEMVMIGTENGYKTGDAKQLVDFYKTVMENNPRYVVGTWDEVEAIKIFYNTWISTKIGLSNMIQDVAERQGNINVDVVTQALAESTMRIMGPQYMKAGMGDGGACHPRDNIALRHMAKRLDLGYDLFDSIMTAREIQAKNIAKKLVSLAKQHNLHKIFIHGEAYKPNVEYCDGSYSLLIGHYLKELGYEPSYIDPLTQPEVYQPLSPAVFLLAHSASTTYKYTDRNSTDNLYCDIPDGSVVLDPWRNYYNKKCIVIHYGNTRQQ